MAAFQPTAILRRHVGCLLLHLLHTHRAVSTAQHRLLLLLLHQRRGHLVRLLMAPALHYYTLLSLLRVLRLLR